mgnify:CR=1 FL=1
MLHNNSLDESSPPATSFTCSQRLPAQHAAGAGQGVGDQSKQQHAGEEADGRLAQQELGHRQGKSGQQGKCSVAHKKTCCLMSCSCTCLAVVWSLTRARTCGGHSRPRTHARTHSHTQVGVLLLNLGGPDTLDDVQPFLYNLFADPDIIRCVVERSGVPTRHCVHAVCACVCVNMLAAHTGHAVCLLCAVRVWV